MFLGKANCVEHFMKNSMIKGGSGNYLKLGIFFLNIVVFSFTIRKGAVHVSKTSESLLNFTTLYIYFHFTWLYYLSQTTVYFMYGTIASLRYVVNGIYHFPYLFIIFINGIFYRIRLYVPKPFGKNDIISPY